MQGEFPWKRTDPEQVSVIEGSFVFNYTKNT
jgi:hypothetical protein